MQRYKGGFHSVILFIKISKQPPSTSYAYKRNKVKMKPYHSASVSSPLVRIQSVPPCRDESRDDAVCVKLKGRVVMSWHVLSLRLQRAWPRNTIVDLNSMDGKPTQQHHRRCHRVQACPSEDRWKLVRSIPSIPSGSLPVSTIFIGWLNHAYRKSNKFNRH